MIGDSPGDFISRASGALEMPETDSSRRVPWRAVHVGYRETPVFTFPVALSHPLQTLRAIFLHHSGKRGKIGKTAVITYRSCLQAFY